MSSIFILINTLADISPKLVQVKCRKTWTDCCDAYWSKQAIRVLALSVKHA